MSIHVALLRGINVGGRNMVAMSDLRDLFESLGLSGAKSVLQSGNVVFKCNRQTGAKLESLLEKETASRLGVAPDYVVRSAAELQRVVSRNPFPKEATDEPGRLVAVFLKEAPKAERVESLEAAIKGPEYIRCDGEQIYVVYPEGIGRSKLTGTLIEQKLGMRGTGRNWNTVLKLAALCK